MDKILDKIIESEALDGRAFKRPCPLPKLDNPFKRRAGTTRLKLSEFLKDDLEIMHPLNHSPSDNDEASGVIDFALDPYYRLTLKNHQLEGLRFMWDRIYRQKKGCLLSHSMGLGKSIQVIALLVTIYQYRKRYPSTEFPKDKRVLIIAPVVTLSNWIEEFDKWSVNLDEILGEIYNFSSIRLGERNARKTQLTVVQHWYSQGGVMLIGYEQFRRLMSEKPREGTGYTFRDCLINPGPDIVILDEGHRIKNASTAIASLISEFNTPLRICLTGYPLQNHLSEYYYMIQAITPGLLGTRDQFKNYFSNVIESCFHDSSQIRKQEASIKMYVLQLLASKVMHRRGESILEKSLPKKTEYLVRFKLSPAQHKGYVFLLKHVVDKMSPLLALFILRALCNHPKIFENLLEKRLEKKRQASLVKQLQEEEQQQQQHREVEEEEDELALLQQFDFDNAKDEKISQYFKTLDTESWSCAGKMAFIADLAVASQAINDKLVIVSHSLACLDYLEHFLPVLGIKMMRVDGSTAGNTRQGIIHSFEEDKEIHVMLLSAKAAGIGINLTAANRIVLVDQDWNPLYDEQSIGRIYRIGQTKPVFVYRLVTASTIEESILNQSVHKNSISRRVIDNSRPNASISKDELRKYYKVPRSEIPLANLKELDPEVSEDPLSKDLYKPNNESIVKIGLYQPASKMNADYLWLELSDKNRRQAKNEAIAYSKKTRR